MNLTREHITLILGINLPLNESFNDLNEDLKINIIYEQLIYENFLDTIKKYAGEKWDKITTTIKDWKDAAVVLGKTISNPEILQNFSDNFWKTFKNGDLKKIEALLKKLKLDNFIPQVESLINKITALKGWQKFLAATSIASITNYIVTQLSTLSADGLKKWITAYFSDSALSTITSKLTDFTTYVGWLQPIIKGTEILYNVLKPTIDKFKFAFNLKPQISETKMKISQLKQLIKEEIKVALKENIPALRIFTRKSDEGNTQIIINATTPGWDDKSITLSKEEAIEMQKLAKEFLGNRNNTVSKGVNTKDKNSTQSIISIEPLKGTNCALTRKEGSIYKGYDEESGSNTGYCVVFQSNIYQVAEDLNKYLSEATAPQQPAVKQTAASKAYQQTATKATTVTAKASQIKSINDLPGAFETWFNSLGLKDKTGVSQATILSKIRETLIKMGVK